MISQLQQLIDQGLVSLHLRKGSGESSSIESMQRVLFGVGYGEVLRWKQFGADGDFGEATLDALKAFANRNNLLLEGESASTEVIQTLIIRYESVHDVRTIHQLGSLGKLTQVLRIGSSHKLDIMALQRLLHILGMDEELKWDEFGADGIYGLATQHAVHSYAVREGLESDGTFIHQNLAQHIIDRFTIFLGPDWIQALNASSLDHSQYNKAYPARGDVHVSTVAFFSIPHLETFINRKKRDPNGNFLRENRTYSYTFEAAAHLNQSDNVLIPYVEVKKFNEAQKRVVSFFYPIDHEKNKPKDKIVLHFTSGRLAGDLQTLTQEDYHVSTAFILGRDGTIYQLYSAQQYSNHIGGLSAPDEAVGGNKVNEGNTIGIEISNWGPLDFDSEQKILTTYTGHNFSTLDETDAYIKLSNTYRDRTYFARPTEEQYDSLILLLRYLTDELDIERNFLPEGKREALFASDEEANAFKGICCHTNFRLGKWDWYEEYFDWERIIKGVQFDHHSIEITREANRNMFLGVQPRTEEDIAAETAGLDFGNLDDSRYGEPGWEVEI